MTSETRSQLTSFFFLHKYTPVVPGTVSIDVTVHSVVPDTMSIDIIVHSMVPGTVSVY